MFLIGGNHGFDFEGYTFNEEVNFEEATFWNRARFVEAAFREGVCFRNTTFEKGAAFNDSTLVEARFLDVSFEGSSVFQESTLIDSKFSETDFLEHCSFTRATFKEVDFEDCSFKARVDIRGSDYSTVTFEEVNFGGLINGAEFPGATFKSVDFSGVSFNYGGEFDGATFQDCKFQDATFQSRVTFRESVFTGEISFQGAEFQDDALFQGSFESPDGGRMGTVDFSNCYFQEGAFFSGSSRESRAFAKAEVDFTGVRLSPRAKLQFRYADLSRCRFLRTNLRNIDFTAVEWHDGFSFEGWLTDNWFRDKYDGGFTTHWFRKKEWFHRVGLYDENCEGASAGAADVSKRGRWREVERLYRQLKRNYEERGDFPRGGDFHIGEKEARRHGEQRWGPWLLLAIYRALSKYGERALPATFWLVGLVLACGVAYLGMGASTESIHLTSFCNLQDWGEALVLSGEATLFPVRSAGFQDAAPRALNLIQRGLSPILIALLALALRQRVKR